MGFPWTDCGSPSTKTTTKRTTSGETKWGWLTIESFSRLNPEFASDIHIWRDLAPSAEEVYEEGLRFVRKMWERADRGGDKLTGRQAGKQKADRETGR